MLEPILRLGLVMLTSHPRLPFPFTLAFLALVAHVFSFRGYLATSFRCYFSDSESDFLLTVAAFDYSLEPFRCFTVHLDVSLAGVTDSFPLRLW